MKRKRLFAVLLAALPLFPPPLPAQESAEEAARREALRHHAAQAEAEGRYKSMVARIEDLEASVNSYKKSVADLTTQVRSLREELAKSANNRETAGLRENIDKLADSIREVDRKRLADNERVLNEIARLAKVLGERGTTPKPPPADSGRTTPASPPNTGGPEKGYEYTIRAGDTLSALVTALRGQGLTVTQKMIMDANPGVNWAKLKVGQKIFIPAPGQ